jgi:hypothetical protein
MNPDGKRGGQVDKLRASGKFEPTGKLVETRVGKEEPMAEYWRYAVSRTPSMFTSQSQAKMSINCDRRPIAICPRVTQSKDEQEENKRNYVLVNAHKEL